MTPLRQLAPPDTGVRLTSKDGPLARYHFYFFVHVHTPVRDAKLAQEGSKFVPQRNSTNLFRCRLAVCAKPGLQICRRYRAVAANLGNYLRAPDTVPLDDARTKSENHQRCSNDSCEDHDRTTHSVIF